MVILRSGAAKRTTEIMAKHQIDYYVLVFPISQIIALSMNIVGATNLENNQIRADTFYLRNFNAPNAISGISSRYWTENHECLIELNAIKNGIDQHEEWAIRGRSNFTFVDF